MSISARDVARLGAFLSAGMIATSAAAQDKGKEAKITSLLENDKVKIFEARYRPGDEYKAIPTTAYRVLRVLKGGTLTRTYADGKTEKIGYKTGETIFSEPSTTTYTVKNNGKSDVDLYIVQLK